LKSAKKVYYWSPSLVNIATNRSVVNSAYSLNKYGNFYKCSIFNFFNEFKQYETFINNNNINLINFLSEKFCKLLPRHGKVKSRFSFILIFLFSFFPLKNLLKKDQPDFFIIHLITSLPLILLILFNFKTKFILRISGLPRMNIIRKFIWKIALKKIYIVTCPTKSTYSYIKKLNIIDTDKIQLLYDPVINIKEINNKKKENNVNFENYYLSVGRLTNQKNFLFLCKAFKELVKENKNFKLLIAGEGEQKKLINSFIKKNNLQDNIILLNHIKNIFPYFVKAKAFILSSLWEDPGFVLVEAAFCRTLVLTNNSEPGPKELIKNEINGIVYEKDNINSFKEKLNLLMNHKNINFLKLNNLKSIKKFTIFNHFKVLNSLLLNN